MKKITGQRILTIAIVIAVSVGLIVGSSFFYGRVSIPPFVQRFSSDVASIFGRGTSAAATALDRSTNSLEQLFATYRENKALDNKVDSLTQQQIEIENLRKENKQLKANLKLEGSLTDYKLTSVSIIGRSPTAWQNQVNINKGLNADIQKNAPVLANKGLVGKVVQVSNLSSKVELISDISTDSDRFPVVIELGDDKSVNGIITDYDTKTGYLIMDQLTSDEDIQKGTDVQTSGLGGVLPKGLYVGKVVKTENRGSGIAKRLFIRPAANLNELSNVMVVTGVGKNAK